MPVNHTLKIIFIHIPKTAGTAIEYALGMHGSLTQVGIKKYENQERNYDLLFGDGLQHLTALGIRKKIGKQQFNEYYKFSIVRNPLDRLVSYAAWLKGKQNQNEPLERKMFSEFLQKQMRYLGWFNSQLPISQHQFVYIGKKLETNSLLKFETLDNDVKWLSTQINREIITEKRMVSEHDHYLSYYTQRELNWVKQWYAKDFTYFNYPY